jgi:hypothetical protein
MLSSHCSYIRLCHHVVLSLFYQVKMRTKFDIDELFMFVVIVVDHRMINISYSIPSNIG